MAFGVGRRAVLVIGKRLVTVLALLCIGMSIRAQTPPCEAAVFVLQDLEKRPAVASPDGHYRVVLGIRSEDDDHGWMRVYKGSKLLRTFQLRNLSAGVFVKWAPDSRAFYFMWSNGGMIGGYSVRAFRVAHGQVEEVPLTRTAERDFERRHPCKARGYNVYAVRWLQGSGQMLLGLQVYPTSDCGKEMGLYRGYLVHFPDGAILRRYSEQQLKAIWPDGCPSAIYPTGLWGANELEQAKKAVQQQKH